MSAVNAVREPNFLLAKHEKRVLTAIARRLPKWILPDDLTAQVQALTKAVEELRKPQGDRK